MKIMSQLIIIGLTLIVTQSCARTVTSLDVPLNIKITLTTQGTINLDRTHIILCFSKTQSPSIPSDTEFNYYLPLPGQMYQNSDANFIEKGLSYYYTNYYSTWSHFIDIHTYSNTTTKLFTAPNTGFILNNNDDHYTYNPINTFDSTYTQTNNTIELSFNISYLNLQKNDTLYFNIITTENKEPDTSQTGYYQDKIDFSGYITMKRLETTGIKTELTNANISNKGTDITQWQVSLF